MAERWEDVDQLFVRTATSDLEYEGQVRPCLVAFAGAALRFIAFVRPFAKGQYADPLIELLALAGPLDADRLALSISGRAWSMEDPIPPVTAGADLRQRALVCEFVDGAYGRPRSRSVLHPFEYGGEQVAWGERIELPGGAQGWVAEVLRVAVRDRRKLAAPIDEIRKQAERCVRLGHDLYLSPPVAERLWMGRPPDDAPRARPRGPGTRHFRWPQSRRPPRRDARS